VLLLEGKKRPTIEAKETYYVEAYNAPRKACSSWKAETSPPHYAYFSLSISPSFLSPPPPTHTCVCVCVCLLVILIYPGVLVTRTWLHTRVCVCVCVCVFACHIDLSYVTQRSLPEIYLSDVTQKEENPPPLPPRATPKALRSTDLAALCKNTVSPTSIFKLLFFALNLVPSCYNSLLNWLSWQQLCGCTLYGVLLRQQRVSNTLATH
jgi:hypothetical protein